MFPPDSPRLDSKKAVCLAYILRTLSIVGLINNLLHLCGMSVDHFIGIAYSINYASMMTKRTVVCAILGIWVISFSCGIIDFIVNVITLEYYKKTAREGLATFNSIKANTLQEYTRLIQIEQLSQSVDDNSILASCSSKHTIKGWLEGTAVILVLITSGFLVACYSLILKTAAQHYGGIAGNRTIRKMILTTVLLLTTYLVW